MAGTYLDDQLRAFVVVLHSDFADYERLRLKLEPISPPLKVVLRPVCYPRERIEEARAVLMARSWHTRASAVRTVWHFDARFSAFSVGFEEAAPEVVAALQQRLGKLVSVSSPAAAGPQKR